jgi:hypothetical protein
VKASLLYRISSILLALFAIGHTVGFSQIDPTWGVDSLVQSMKSIHFNVNGADRTYWDFFFGFGLFVTVLMLFRFHCRLATRGPSVSGPRSCACQRLGVRSLLCCGRVPELALFLHKPDPIFDCDLSMSRGCGVAFRPSSLNGLPVRREVGCFRAVRCMFEPRVQ